MHYKWPINFLVSLTVATGRGQAEVECRKKKKIGSKTKRDGSKQASKQEGPLQRAGLPPSWHCLMHVAQAGLEQDGAGWGRTKLKTNREGQRSMPCHL